MSNIRTDLQLYSRIPDPKTIHDERYNPNTYISVQSKVNNDSEFENLYLDKLIKDGWVSLRSIQDIFLYPKGRMFKYRLNGNSLSGAPEGTFRSGGFYLGKNLNEEDYKINDYILYKAYNGVIFPLQLKDILELYIKNPKKDISVFKKPCGISNYPVYLVDKYGKDTIIYYAKDYNQLKRFTNTIKYKKALATGIWSWSVVFNN